MVDCGVQSSMPHSQFELLDVIFLSRLADKLNKDRETVINASQEVVADLERNQNLQDDDDEAGPSEPIVEFETFAGFRHAYEYGSPAGTERSGSIRSTENESIISGSPNNFYFGI